MSTRIIYNGDNIRLEECSDNGIVVWYLISIDDYLQRIYYKDELTAFAKRWIEYVENEK